MQITDLPSSFILTADIGGSHITAGIYNTITHAIMEESLIRVEVVSKGAADEGYTGFVGKRLQTGAKQYRCISSGP